MTEDTQKTGYAGMRNILAGKAMEALLLRLPPETELTDEVMIRVALNSFRMARHMVNEKQRLDAADPDAQPETSDRRWPRRPDLRTRP